MPARVVLVHDDPAFTAEVMATLWGAGYEVAAFADSLVALGALERAETTELLVTRIAFPAGRPHGLSLARIVRLRRKNIKILFLCHPEYREHVEDEGEFMVHPIAMQELLAAVERLLGPGAAPAM